RTIRCFYPLLRPTPSSTLFPYTTLFRSLPTRELARELRGIHAHEHGAVPQPDEFVRERPGIAQPQRKQAPHADPRQRTLPIGARSEEHTSELQSRGHLVCRLLLEKKNTR